jgi:hypothetical protein
MVRDESGRPVEPALISYTIYLIGEDGRKILVAGPQAQPSRGAEVGLFFVGMTLPSNWGSGDYQVVWSLQQYPDSEVVNVIDDFRVVSANPMTSSMEAPSVLMASTPVINQKTADMVTMVRELLSDTNPDRNYHFRPPTPGKVVAGYSTRVGFIWTDTTIIRMLKLAISKLNTANPMADHGYTLENIHDDWANAAALGAAAFCLSAEAARWTADEFGYSLNGVSLDLQKAAGYQGLAEQYRAELNEWLPNLTANRPVSVGLRQSRWLLG